MPLVDALRVFPVEHLLEVCAHVQGQTLMEPGAPGVRGPIDGQHVELSSPSTTPNARSGVATTS
jgi:hypothetical protein